MKILIWILCFFVNSFITTLIKTEIGINLGAIPTILMYAATFWLARTLCKKWDEHRENKAIQAETCAMKEVAVDNSDRIRFCRRCGERLIDGSQFCRKCGTEVVKE
ncbi:MAG: zinc ribbon domain-containing protein [Clostridia bacterium]|nr:zinc ribbon domain-containing protein [Clostridia bacterium]